MTTESLSAEVRAALHHHMVICVADDPDVLTVLRRFLTNLPCQLHATESPEEALGMLAKYHVSLVLADQRMKTMSGQELLQEVARRSPVTARVLLAAYPEAHDIIKTEEDTVHGIIGKPWDGHSLQRTIIAILKWQEERSRLALDTKSMPLPTKTSSRPSRARNSPSTSRRFERPSDDASRPSRGKKPRRT